MSGIKRNAVILGITGGIACGKSEVGRILREMGFRICDADHVAHALMAEGTPVHRAVVKCFGEQVLAADGSISRPTLGRMVFDDPDLLQQLNRLIHPAVKAVLEQWISDRRANGDNAAVQLPLLFESGMNTLDWDAIICVSSSEEQVRERLRQRGMNDLEARKRMAAQMPLKEKENLSDRVIHNFGTMQELEEATRAAVQSLMVER
jgi:dephospho-CoA kinase